VRRADHSSRGVLPRVVCLRVIMNPRQCGSLGPQRGCCTLVKKNDIIKGEIIFRPLRRDTVSAI